MSNPIQSKRQWHEAEKLARRLHLKGDKMEGRTPFPKKRKPMGGTSKRPGVYVIYDPEGRVVHVGRTANKNGGLSARLRDHLAGKSSFVDIHLDGEAAGSHNSQRLSRGPGSGQ